MRLDSAEFLFIDCRMTLLETTRKLIAQREHVVKETCAELGVTERWYYNLKAGKEQDWSLDMVQRLHDYLKTRRRRRMEKV